MGDLAGPGSVGAAGESTGGEGERHPNPPDDLAARWPLRWQAIRVRGREIRLFALRDPDALLDAMTQEEFDRTDARMPYWGTVWPSALALAEEVLAGPALERRRVLDLGCGLGLAGLAALARGAQVTFLDWESAAVRLACASARAAGFDAVEGIEADWRSPPPIAPFHRILGADVLYEARNGPAVAAFLAAHLEADGEAWIVDPDRLHARRFPADLPAAGLALRDGAPLPPREGAARLTLWRIGRS